MPDTAARPRRISDESSSRVPVRYAATRFAARSPPASSRRTVSHLVRSHDRAHHSKEKRKQKNTSHHHARSRTRRPTARRRHPTPLARLPTASAVRTSSAGRLDIDPIRKRRVMTHTRPPPTRAAASRSRTARPARSSGRRRRRRRRRRATHRDASRAYLLLDSSRARAARESRPASTRPRAASRVLGVGVPLRRRPVARSTGRLASVSRPRSRSLASSVARLHHHRHRLHRHRHRRRRRRRHRSVSAPWAKTPESHPTNRRAPRGFVARSPRRRPRVICARERDRARENARQSPPSIDRLDRVASRRVASHRVHARSPLERLHRA